MDDVIKGYDVLYDDTVNYNCFWGLQEDQSQVQQVSEGCGQQVRGSGQIYYRDLSIVVRIYVIDDKVEV